jgi:hypothetical protein
MVNFDWKERNIFSRMAMSPSSNVMPDFSL